MGEEAADSFRRYLEGEGAEADLVGWRTGRLPLQPPPGPATAGEGGEGTGQ